jgi:hypothetical protein
LKQETKEENEIMNNETETENANGAALPLNGNAVEDDQEREDTRKAARRNSIDPIGAAIAKKKQGEKELVALRVTLEAQLAAVKELVALRVTLEAQLAAVKEALGERGARSW